MWTAFSIICLTQFATGLSQLRDSKCPGITYKSHFNMSQFQGKWYQQAKFGSLLFGGLNTCGLLACEYDPDFDELYINYSSTSSLDHINANYTGDAVYRHLNKRDGILEVTWDYDPESSPLDLRVWLHLSNAGPGDNEKQHNICQDKQEAVTNLFIVETNYEDFTILASCSNSVISGWVVTRAQQLLLEENVITILAKIFEAMKNVKNLQGGLLLDAQLGCN